ncbi:Thiosulfate sulfurtransferase GlpE [Acidibacillus sp. S0AB]|uniref:Thiosulfate sulfurtransferase GlpE n=2 Tax=Sulfoacidibacillus ferrooxidans TaxID=2005001 RepID=A0A9X1V608_9BACL|nr:Thiosulfate sulfurtransferase GlpE [Sulfoacidibacillus ferrooxidans]
MRWPCLLLLGEASAVFEYMNGDRHMHSTTLIILAVIVFLIVYTAMKRRGGAGVRSIPASQLEEAMKSKNGKSFLDVREPGEYRGGHVAGMKNLPLSQLSSRLSEVPKDHEVYVMCRSGHRSMQAANILKKAGYVNVINVSGGISAWHGPIKK